MEDLCLSVIALPLMNKGGAITERHRSSMVNQLNRSKMNPFSASTTSSSMLSN
jgi:hypothetical protein